MLPGMPGASCYCRSARWHCCLHGRAAGTHAAAAGSLLLCSDPGQAFAFHYSYLVSWLYYVACLAQGCIVFSRHEAFFGTERAEQPQLILPRSRTEILLERIQEFTTLDEQGLSQVLRNQEIQQAARRLRAEEGEALHAFGLAEASGVLCLEDCWCW